MAVIPILAVIGEALWNEATNNTSTSTNTNDPTGNNQTPPTPSTTTTTTTTTTTDTSTGPSTSPGNTGAPPPPTDEPPDDDDCDYENDPDCVDWAWDIRGLLKNRRIPQPAGIDLIPARIEEVRAYINQYNNFHRELGVLSRGHIAILQAKGQWFIGFNHDVEGSVADNVYVNWDETLPADAQVTVKRSEPVRRAEFDENNAYTGWGESHAESNALLELWASGISGPGQGLMVVNGIVCGACYDRQTKTGYIVSGAQATNISITVISGGSSIQYPE